MSLIEQRITAEFKAQLIHLCRADPNAFIEYTHDIVQGSLHVEIQQVLSDYDDVSLELPRGHGKTVQVDGRCAWEIGHNCEILISLVQSTEDDSHNSVSSIKGILESERFKEVFPEIEKDPSLWGKEAFKVRRQSVGVKDPTLSAQPIFGNAGKRMDLLVFDDIANLDNSVRQPAKREQVKQAYRETWLPSLKKNGRCWRVFTPWHVDDVGALWKADKTIHTMSRPCEGTRSSPWPEWWLPDMLVKRRLQMGSTAYDRAYALKPMSADEQVFFPASVRHAFYDISMYNDELRRRQFFENATCVIATDMAYTEADQISNKKAEPDFSCIIVALILPNGHIYLIDYWMGKEKFTVTLDKLYGFVAVYKPSKVLLEEVGAMKGINDIVAQSLNADMVRLTRNKDKFSRAIEQQPVVERGRFHMPGIQGNDYPDERWIPVYNQLTEFPFSKNDDATDCCVDLMAQVNTHTVTQAEITSFNRVGDPLLVATHFTETREATDPGMPNIDGDPDDIAEFLARIHGGR